MSYEVLARKWRPQTFDELVGQDHIAGTLKKAVELGRISHAYLLSGPRGCGKTSTARILAKVINCTKLDGGNPCNACASCTGVVQGRNLDVMEIDGASHTGVNEVRDLQESIGYTASQFENKVYIIDEVHMLSTHAFNALLKTLEEPPEHVYFIFATTAPHKIPDTIKSRCQRHQFRRLEVREISRHLGKICAAEKVEFEAEALRLLARKAEGSMRDAESLLDQCITAASGEVKSDTVRQTLGLLDHTMVFDFLSTIAEGDATAVLGRLNDAVRDGVDLEELLGELIEGFRDLMLLSVPGDLRDLIYRSKDEIESMQGLLSSYELGDLVAIVERLCNVNPRLKVAADPRILLESVLVDIALLDRQTDIRGLISRLEGSAGGGAETAARSAGKRRPPPKNAAPPGGSARYLSEARDGKLVESRPRETAPGAGALQSAPAEPAEREVAPAMPASPPDWARMDYADARKLWDGFVTMIRQKKLSLGVCLVSGTIKSIDGHSVRLRFARGFSYQKAQVEAAANRSFLETMMKKYFGRQLDIICESDGEETAQKPEDRASGDDNESGRPTREIETRPLVRKILADFDGEIVRYHPR